MVYRQTQLYKFLDYCNKSELEKVVLDCGAGGNIPPLGIFYNEGYKTYGIEIDKEQLALSKSFEEENNMKLNIEIGDMRKLPFGDGCISFVYSFGSIFHMSKAEVYKSLNEIFRVLKPGGLCYINLLSVDDFRCGQGKLVGENEYLQDEGGVEILHSYFTEEEGDKLFEKASLLYKEKRVFQRIYNGELIKQGAIDYIVRK